MRIAHRRVCSALERRFDSGAMFITRKFWPLTGHSWPLVVGLEEVFMPLLAQLTNHIKIHANAAKHAVTQQARASTRC